MTTKTYPTKWYNETMQGAGQTGSTTAGTMIAILKACLVDGFGALVPDTIVWDSGLGWAKASFGAGHSYLVDSIISCSGATPADYNGEHRVMQVTTNDMWFELDTTPGADASGTLEIKIAPLGWSISHANGTNDVLIFQAAGDLGNVSLRVDNTAYSGWSGSYGAYLMKVAMVENVVDIDTYDTIDEYCWPATGNLSDHKWDLAGDNRIIYFMPEYATAKKQPCFYAGYFDTHRAGDRYHFMMNRVPSTNASDPTYNRWSSSSSSYLHYTSSLKNLTTEDRVIARKYHQLEGTTGWQKTGLGTYNSDIMPLPNPVDNGFYINTDQAMILESDGVYRGDLPIMVWPLANNTALYRKNLQDLPEFPGKIFRMLRATYDRRSDLGTVLVGFDISTVEV